MRYLTYNDYLNIGGTLEFSAFERVIDRACGVIDTYTFGRLRGDLEVSQTVMACVRDLCDTLVLESSNNGKTVASRSQSAGGVSESETYTVKSADDVKAGMRDIIYDYLATETDANGTPLLYRGCAH